MAAQLEILVADITTLDLDAIVNAANSGLSGGGGARAFELIGVSPVSM